MDSENYFKLAGKHYKAIFCANAICDGCAFEKNGTLCADAPFCWKEAREDKRDVIFILDDSPEVWKQRGILRSCGSIL